MPRYRGRLEQSVELAIFQTRMAAVLNEMRRNRLFKLKDLAKRVGVSNTYMTKIMRGQANISLSLLFPFSRELDVTVVDLIGDRADNSVDMTDGAFPRQDNPEGSAA